MNEQAPARRGLPYIVLGLAIILAGGTKFAYSLVHGLLHLTDGLTQFVAPGQVVLPLTKSGTYTIFLEQQSVMDGKIYSTTESVAGLRCTAARQDSGQTMVLRKPGGSITYTVGGRSGRSVLEFNAEQPGQYVLSCSYPEQAKGPEVVLAVGTGVGSKIFSTVMSSLAALFGGGAIGAFFLVIGYRKRQPSPCGMSASLVR